MTERIDASRTLQDVEGEDWGDPAEAPTRLVSAVLTVRRKPLGQLDAEDLRVTILQKVGLQALVPLALDVLENDPFAEGDLYPGALLTAVVRVPPEYWSKRPELAARLDTVAERALAAEPSDGDDPWEEPRVADGELRADIAAFRAGTVVDRRPRVRGASPAGP